MPTSGGATPAGPLERQAAWLERYEPGIRIEEQGKVVSVGDGIAWIAGLPSVPVDEIVTFADGSEAMVFDLTEGLVGVVLLHDSEAVTAGAPVRRTGRTLSMPVGDGLLGRVVDPLGKPLDGNPEPAHTRWQALDAPAPGVAARDFVQSPLYTGIKIIDTMIPIGKGQRQLLIGDEGLGRSSIALDTVINQRGQNVYCIYVLIGQKRSTVVNTIELLRKFDALQFSTIIAAEASSRPGLQHLAPFAGCALAEFWMHQGRDVLIVYDDLTAHATTYRELSLLLRHPPGREAFPGDIFSVHARLLERATCLNPEHGGGSMTALPIVATKLGEIAAYIPTNLISITDGQIYLERSLFSAGFRPAIDIAASVSRIGGRAQHHRIKEEAGRMKLDYLQFLELEAFTRFGARLEASVEAAIRKGRQLREILKQDRFSQLSKEQQLAWLIAFNDRQFDAEEPETLGRLFGAFEQSMQGIALDLDSAREQWSSLVAERIAALRQTPA